jgi:ubiquinone/menaquinone biosynthesis C-methylase UbiE
VTTTEKVYVNGNTSPTPSSDLSNVSQYWTDVNVTFHQTYNSAQESLDLLRWRNSQYLFIEELMPYRGYEGQTVLDYGCGPGHDVLGFALYSEAKRIIGMDVSRTSLEEAQARLRLHNASNVEFKLIRDDPPSLPLEDESVDYISSSGVLHHVRDLGAVLSELKRVLRPNGRMRIMLYNYDSIFMHLYIPYCMQMLAGTYGDKPLHEAFRRSTDGESCPISKAYKPREVEYVGERAGFKVKYLDSAISSSEMAILPKRFDALMDVRLEHEHRDFLANLTFDKFGRPIHEGYVAGVDAVFELVKA